jgi:hypothetical protein
MPGNREGGTSMSDRDEHEYEAHDEPPPVSRVRLGTEEDLQRDFGSTPLLIGLPVTSQPPVEDMLVQPKIPYRGQRIASIERSLRRRKAGSKEPGSSDAQRKTKHDEQR